MKARIKKLGASFAVLFVIGFAGPVWADGESQQIAQYKEMLAKQAELDSSNAVQKDREMAEKWLKEAEVLLANGDGEAASRRLRRVEFAIDLIRALVAAAQIREAAEEQEAAAYKAPERAKELEDKIEELRKRKAELERELKGLR